MHRRQRFNWAIAVTLALAATSDLPSQITRNRAGPSAADVAASLRAYARGDAALAVLTQARRPQSAEKMDEMADTLLAFAMSFPGKDARGSSTRVAALTTLLLAGLGETNIVGIKHGIPYARAVDRIMRIAEAANDVGIRGAAVYNLATLPRSPTTLPFLRQLAASTNPAASEAVTVLAIDAGPEGRAIAHELYLNKQVIERGAQRTMAGMAAAYGWK